MRLNVRVQPGARRTEVGGRYGSTDPPILVVRVTSPATDGRANQAVIDALAGAFGVPRRHVRIVSGLSNRSKIIVMEGADPALLEQLLG